MKTSVRKTLATILLSGTTALAGPVLAQEANQGGSELLVPQGQGQGSAQTEGGADTNAGAVKGDAGANATAKTPESGTADQDSAQTGSGIANGETGAQTTEMPDENNVKRDAAQSTDDGSAGMDRQKTAEGAGGDPAAEDDAATNKAQSTTEGENDAQSAAGSNAADTDESTASAPSDETTASIDITTEQRTEIRNVIVEKDVEPVDVDFEVSIGTVVPETVELHPLPPRIIEIVPAYSSYQYIILADGRILIIEPATLEIVYVISA